MTTVWDPKVRNVTTWEINPYNRGPEPKYIGVGRQLLWYAIAREIKDFKETRLLFEIRQDPELTTEGLKGLYYAFTVLAFKEAIEGSKGALSIPLYGPEEIAEPMINRWLKTLKYFEDAILVGDKDAAAIWQEIEAVEHTTTVGWSI